MRRTYSLLTPPTIFLSLIAAPAFADVRPVAVKVLFEDKPRPAVKNVPFRATLEFVAAYDTEITNIRIEGQGWQVRSFNPPARVQLFKKQSLPVPFEVQSSHLANKLTVHYEADGQAFSRVLDFSPEAYKKATTSGGVFKR